MIIVMAQWRNVLLMKEGIISNGNVVKMMTEVFSSSIDKWRDQ